MTAEPLTAESYAAAGFESRLKELDQADTREDDDSR